MNDTRSRLVISLFAFVPYLLVAWAYMTLVNGDSSDFWKALGVLVAVRFFFSVIETLGTVISWRLYGKRFMVNKFVEFLRANNFPKRKYAHDDFLNYLARIEDEPSCPASVKASAKEIYFVLSTFESMGILLGMRMHSASEAALDAYSPKSEAPIFGATAA
jgi:hypothetical protein